MEKRADEIYNRIGIYGIRNKINGKIYIGKTGMNFGDRWDSHRSLLRSGKHMNQYLQRAWDKYGEENFEFIVIEDCGVDELNDKEIFYINFYREQNLAYNIHDGGCGGLFLGKHLSDETKRKIGEKNREHMLGRKMSQETRDKMSTSQLARYAQWTEEDRMKWGEKTSQYASGYTWSNEAKEKMKNNKNGAKYSIDQVRQIREMHENDGLSYQEISDILCIPKHTVYLIATYRRWKDC